MQEPGSEIGYLARRPVNAKFDLRSIALQLNAVKKARVLVIDANQKLVAQGFGPAFDRDS
jgi:hypothetical protein